MLKIYYEELGHQVARNALYEVSQDLGHKGCALCIDRIEGLYGWASALSRYGYSSESADRIYFPSTANAILQRFSQITLGHESAPYLM